MNALLLAALLLPMRGDAVGPELLTVYTSNWAEGTAKCAEMMLNEPKGSQCRVVFVWPWDDENGDFTAEPLVLP